MRPARPREIVLTSEQLQSCVDSCFLELVDYTDYKRFVNLDVLFGSGELISYAVQKEVSKFVRRALRNPYGERKLWVYQQAKGRMLEDLCIAFTCARNLAWNKVPFVIPLDWVSSLIDALRGNNWMRIENPMDEVHCAELPRLTEETLRDWVRLRGNPDFWRYLRAYRDKNRDDVPSNETD